MAKKSQNFDLITEAISKIKEIKSQDSGDNPYFIEAIDKAEISLFNRLYGEASKNADKAKSRGEKKMQH